jgi:hypothetical protein
MFSSPYTAKSPGSTIYGCWVNLGFCCASVRTFGRLHFHGRIAYGRRSREPGKQKWKFCPHPRQPLN